MGILIYFSVIFLSVIGAIYLFVFLKKRPKKTDYLFAFNERRRDLTNFLNEFCYQERKDNENWGELVEKFKKNYPDYYKRIDKKFLDNYFKF